MKLTLNLASRPFLNRRSLLLSYAIVAALLLLLLVAQVNFWWQSNRQCILLQTRIGEIEKSLGIDVTGASYTPEQFASLAAKIDFSNGLIQKESFRWTTLLDKLEAVMTANARITSIRPNFKNGSMDLEGQCKNVADLRALLDSLIGSSEFSNAYLLVQSEQLVDTGKGVKQKRVVYRIKVEGVLK